ncbi:glycosyltransferase [Candidatus Aenigmatarchaeota archaeon]
MHSIVVPAYNEENRVSHTLDDYTEFFDKKNVEYEIIVVCDGCTDNTVGVVRGKAKINNKIKLFEVDRRLGKGGGVYYGFSKCDGRTIGFVDADNAIRPQEYDKLLQTLEKTDAVIASRRTKESSMTIPNAKKAWLVSMRAASRIYNVIVNVMFGIGIKDTQCGAKIMKRPVYDDIRNELKLSGFEFDVELIWRIKKHKYEVKEVGISWYHDLDSKSSIKNSFNMFISLLKRRLEG